MGDLNAAQRAWLKSVGADIDVVEAPAASEQPAPRAATMTAGAIEPGAATASAGAGGGGGGNDDGGSGSDADGGGKKGDKGGKGGKGDKGGKDGGKGGGPAKSTNQGRIDQLKAWEKDGTILKGSSKELRDQLADKRDKVLQKLAEDKFDKIDLASKEKPDTGPVSRHVPKPAVGSQIDPDDPSARVRGGPKEPLEKLLKQHGLSEKEIIDFGNWLKERHRKVKAGREVPLDSKQKPPDEHDHMYSPEEIEGYLRENESEHGRKLGNRDKAQGGG